MQYDYNVPKSFDIEDSLYFKFTLYEEFKFDYVEISYTATENITLEDADVDRIEYSGKETSFYKEFSATTTLKGISLKFSEIVFDIIKVRATVYKDGEIVDTKSALTIPVIASEYGVFYYYGDPDIPYYAYLNRLLELGLIDYTEHHNAKCTYGNVSVENNKEKNEEAESDIEKQVVN